MTETQPITTVDTATFVCPICRCAYATRPDRDECWRADLQQQALREDENLPALMGED